MRHNVISSNFLLLRIYFGGTHRYQDAAIQLNNFLETLLYINDFTLGSILVDDNFLWNNHYSSFQIYLGFIPL